MLEKAKGMLQSQNKLLQFRSPAELFLIKLALAKTKIWYVLVGSDFVSSQTLNNQNMSSFVSAGL